MYIKKHPPTSIFTFIFTVMAFGTVDILIQSDLQKSSVASIKTYPQASSLDQGLKVPMMCMLVQYGKNTRQGFFEDRQLRQRKSVLPPTCQKKIRTLMHAREMVGPIITFITYALFYFQNYVHA